MLSLVPPPDAPVAPPSKTVTFTAPFGFEAAAGQKWGSDSGIEYLSGVATVSTIDLFGNVTEILLL